MYVITNRLKKFGISLTPQVDCNVNYVQELALIKLKPQSFGCCGNNNEKNANNANNARNQIDQPSYLNVLCE